MINRKKNTVCVQLCSYRQRCYCAALHLPLVSLCLFLKDCLDCWLHCGSASDGFCSVCMSGKLISASFLRKRVFLLGIEFYVDTFFSPHFKDTGALLHRCQRKSTVIFSFVPFSSDCFWYFLFVSGLCSLLYMPWCRVSPVSYAWCPSTFFLCWFLSHVTFGERSSLLCRCLHASLSPVLLRLCETSITHFDIVQKVTEIWLIFWTFIPCCSSD